MSKKTDRALHGPSWSEVILGAFLSLLLGAVLGAVLLIVRPPVVAKEEPKEREPGRVYYIEGAKNASKARDALAKRKALLEGRSVSVTEEEINALLAPSAAPAGQPTKQAEKGKDGADAGKSDSADGLLNTGAANVRIRDGKLQVSVPVTIGLVDQKVIAQASGGFVKEGDIFVFEPDTLYLGSCPLQRLPLVAEFVRNRFLAAQPIPEDIKTVWPKLANVTIEGRELKLTMP